MTVAESQMIPARTPTDLPRREALFLVRRTFSEPRLAKRMRLERKEQVADSLLLRKGDVVIESHAHLNEGLREFTW